MVVKDHDLTVTGQTDIAFYARANIERGTECSQAIFRNAGPVESAMREPHGPWI